MQKVQSWHQGDIYQLRMAHLTCNAHSNWSRWHMNLSLFGSGRRKHSRSRFCTFTPSKNCTGGVAEILIQPKLKQLSDILQCAFSWKQFNVFTFASFTSVCILHSSWCNQGFAGLVKDWESGRIIVWGVTVGWFLPPPCILTTVLFFSFIIRIMQQYYTEHSAACKAEGVQYYVTMETKFRKGFWSSCNYIQLFVKHRFWLLRA